MKRRQILACAGVLAFQLARTSHTGAQEAISAEAATPLASPSETSLRGARYCEILAPAPGASRSQPELAVYNTQGLNDCPADLWEAITPAGAACDLHVPLAFKNGPRYWAFDQITAELPPGEVVVVGGLEMRPVATLQLPPGTSPTSSKPYSPMQVARTTQYVFLAGKPVFALTGTDGAVYVMQTFPEGIDPGPDLTGLAAIGDDLTLPAGWTFHTETPETDLAVVAVDGMATVVRDDLGNTYQLLETAP